MCVVLLKVCHLSCVVCCLVLRFLVWVLFVVRMCCVVRHVLVRVVDC